MIYRKDANFPYPVLASTSNGYTENYFSLDVDINENLGYYHFQIDYEIDSEYMKELLETGKARLILIIQTKDNKFFYLEKGQHVVKVHKSRITLKNRISVQLHIQAKQDLNFTDNNDLSSFYHQFREGITVPRFSLLGYSNVAVFDGSIKKPFELFEKRLDENMKSDIKVELGQETIIIHYKKPEYQFNHLPKGTVLNNPYIYTGLTKALQAFIINNSEDGDVDIDEMEEPEGALDLKLFNLMKKKMVTELNYDNIDEVIHTISDRIIEKYTTALGEMVTNGS